MRTTTTIISALALLVLASAAQAQASSSVEITRAEFGERWPFTIDKGTLRCTNGVLITFERNGLQYPINGAARMAMKQQPKLGCRDVKEILTPNAALGAIIQRGLTLCKDGR